MRGSGAGRKDTASGLLVLGIVLIVLSPVWLVVLLGLAAPVIIAAILLAIPVAIVRRAFRRGSP